MSAATSQQVAGLVVNAKLNTAREDFDRLKATLHNCLQHGPASQNRSTVPYFREHLAGRIAHITQMNPARGAKLRGLFDRINFEGEKEGVAGFPACTNVS